MYFIGCETSYNANNGSYRITQKRSEWMSNVNDFASYMGSGDSLLSPPHLLAMACFERSRVEVTGRLLVLLSSLNEARIAKVQVLFGNQPTTTNRTLVCTYAQSY